MFNQTRTFGIEIEFTGTSRRAVSQEITARGIFAEAEGYNHSTRSYWKVVSDSSVTGSYDNFGGEVVSPPLSGQDGLDQITIVVEAIKAVGGTVDLSCGLHVHHDVNDLSARQVANIVAVYRHFEADVIDFLVSPSRRRNTYCQPVSNEHTWTELRNLQQLPDKDELKTVARQTSRYNKVNLQSLVKYGTVEFRQHQGTLNATKLISWIVFTQALVEWAITAKPRFRPSPRTLTWHDLAKKLSWIPCKRTDDCQLITDAYEYLKARHRHFKSAA